MTKISLKTNYFIVSLGSKFELTSKILRHCQIFLDLLVNYKHKSAADALESVCHNTFKEGSISLIFNNRPDAVAGAIVDDLVSVISTLHHQAPPDRVQ
jgi:hypothetical protein